MDSTTKHDAVSARLAEALRKTKRAFPHQVSHANPGAAEIVGRSARSVSDRLRALAAAVRHKTRTSGPKGVEGAEENVDDFRARLAKLLKTGQSAKQPSAAREAAATLEAGVSEGPVGTGDHVVRSGECVSSIAKDTGHFWQTIWDDPANGALKEIRRNPNVLLAGDRLAIPNLEPKHETGQTEQRHRFVRLGEPSRLALVVKSKCKALANAPYVIEIDGRMQITGTTDAAGKIDVPIPGDAQTAVVTVEQPDAAPKVYKLRLGGLDPITTNTGVQARLVNLGFSCGSEKGEIGPKTLAALNRFRASVGLPTSDVLDDATRRELENVHDYRKATSSVSGSLSACSHQQS